MGTLRRQGLSCTLHTVSGRLAGQQTLGSHLSPPAPTPTRYSHHTPLLSGCLGPGLWSLCLLSKSFPQRAISPFPPFTYLFIFFTSASLLPRSVQASRAVGFAAVSPFFYCGGSEMLGKCMHLGALPL